jgi:hypothetical protein
LLWYDHAALPEGADPLPSPGIIYIDTEHSYECLSRELEIWQALGNEKTLWVFHDTVGFPAMTQALYEAVAPGGRFYETHEDRLLWHTCSGLSALTPKAGWPQ